MLAVNQVIVEIKLDFSEEVSVEDRNSLAEGIASNGNIVDYWFYQKSKLSFGPLTN